MSDATPSALPSVSISGPVPSRSPSVASSSARLFSRAPLHTFRLRLRTSRATARRRLVWFSHTWASRGSVSPYHRSLRLRRAVRRQVSARAAVCVPPAVLRRSSHTVGARAGLVPTVAAGGASAACRQRRRRRRRRRRAGQSRHDDGCVGTEHGATAAGCGAGGRTGFRPGKLRDAG